MNGFKTFIVLLLFSCLNSMQAWAGENLIRIDSVQVFPTQQAQIGIEVINADVFTSFQLDIPLPEGFSFVSGSAALNPLRKGNHNILASVIGGNTLRLISFSITNEAFTGNSGELASFILMAPVTPAEHILQPANFLLGNPSGQNIATGKIDGAIRSMAPLSVEITSSTTSLCQGQSVSLTAVVSGGGWHPNFSWSSSPVGLSGNQSGVVFTPIGTTICMIQVFDGFQNASNQIVIETMELPVAQAGQDIYGCYGTVVQLFGTTQNATNALWSGGNGIFENPSSAQTVYYPNEADLLAGSVELVLTAFGSDLCPVDSDTLLLILHAPATVEAGNGTVVIYQAVYQNTDAAAGNYSALYWSANGDGVFVDPTQLHCIYHPGENDIVSGHVKLSLTAFGNTGCTAVTDSLHLIILSEDDNVMLLPVIEAGLSDTVVLGISVNNRTTFAAFEMRIPLPSSMEWLSETAVLSARAQDHVFDIQFNGNELHLHAYSESGSPFSGNSGVVFNISFLSGNQTGTFPLPLQEAALIDTSGINILTNTYDGVIQISLVDTKENYKSQKSAGISLYPMPISHESVLQIKLTEKADIHLNAFNLNGQLLFSNAMGIFQEGTYHFRVHEINNILLQQPGLLLFNFQLNSGESINQTIKFY